MTFRAIAYCEPMQHDILLQYSVRSKPYLEGHLMLAEISATVPKMS